MLTPKADRDSILRSIVDGPSLTRRVYSQSTRSALELNELPLQVLAALALDGPLGIGQLATRLALSKGSVSTTLKRLEESGLVATSDAPSTDPRRRMMGLTPAGRAIADRLVEAASVALQSTTEGSSADR